MPSAKPSEIYQGSDWLTYRWTAAQAFDTLDRIRDLCLQMPVSVAIPGREAPRFEAPADEIADMFGYIVELCDDLAGELDTFHADLGPALYAAMGHAWVAFEMRLHLKDLRTRALKEAETAPPVPAPPDAILALAARIKVLLKHIDQ
jgi:hypothetical protein